MAVKVKVQHRVTASGLRPVDPVRDMAEIVELIAVGFERELDPQGQKMLAQMRQTARHSALMSLVRDPNLDSTGFVWVEDGQVVGNLSLRNALPGRSRGEMIGNVVVHPEYRGMGIARALVEAAIHAAQVHRSRWIGLEVRDGNPIATGLYARYGFRAVGRQLHLLRPADVLWPNFDSPARTWRASKPNDRLSWADLANTIYPEGQRHVLEVRPSLYNFGSFERRFSLWLSGERERAWLCGEERVRLALRVKTDIRHRFHFWDVLVHPKEEEPGARASIAKALQTTQRFKPWPVITFAPEDGPLTQTLYSVGFRLHRTLVQMVLDL